jgi:methane monooxygenase PmoA-like
MSTLDVAGVPVAETAEPDLDIRLAPRPYLHPVRTLGGTVVTDALCHDHPWHLGASVTLADVAGRNFWGGRTYVRDEGYVWLDDHGRIVTVAPGELEWQEPDGTVVLREQRSVSAAAAPHGWELTFRYALSTPGPAEVVIGSPVTHGRPLGAGYGGFFWRAAPGPARAFADGGAEAHGSAADWLALTVGDAGTLVFRGLAGDDRWFVRTEEYAGVCAALAWAAPLPIKPGAPLTREIRVLVADGVLTPEQITRAVAVA